MKYKPGSFSKNFAWHGTGLRKLYAAIRTGFENILTAVPREQWRSNSNIGDSALQLIPLNFFLHNVRGRVSPDELVYQAIARPHSLEFDRLGLFALHLNRVGKPPGGIERPAMWANEFVREVLWRDGAWQTAALADSVIDPFIADRMDATPGVREKCRNNYRHLFELCRYLPARLPVINSGADHWMGWAIFLAWDRFVLDHGTQSRPSLVGHAGSEELYKLLGVPRSRLDAQVTGLADLYLTAGGLGRFNTPAPPRAPPELPGEVGSEWLQQGETDQVVGRRLQQVRTQQRDRRKAAALRQHYGNTCMACGVKLQVGRSEFYAEAAHVKPLGKPHNGPDKAANMLVLCPNHHLQFDSGVLSIKMSSNEYLLISKVPGDPLHGQALKLKHVLDEECVKWHHDWFVSTWR